MKTGELRLRKQRVNSSLKDEQENKWGKMFQEENQPVSKVAGAAQEAGPPGQNRTNCGQGEGWEDTLPK